MLKLRVAGICLMAAILLVPAISGSTTSSFPGPPLALDELWSESTFVGLVKITNVKVVGNQNHATMSLEKSLKSTGDTAKKINVYVLLGGCPYPFDFRVGQQLLVFLKYDGDRKMYTTVGADETAMELDDETFLLYSKRLLELPAILSIADKSKKNHELLEWYLTCAESPKMRSDGAWGINVLRHRKRAKLSHSQSLEIVEFLTREDPPSAGSAELYHQISDFPSKKIDSFLLAALRRSHEPGWSELTRSAIETLPRRLGMDLEESTAKRLDEYWDLLNDVYYGVDNDEQEDELQSSDVQIEDEAVAKKRLAVFWGSLSFEIYLQCRNVIDNRKK